MATGTARSTSHLRADDYHFQPLRSHGFLRLWGVNGANFVEVHTTCPGAPRLGTLIEHSVAEDRISYRALTAHDRELLVTATLGNLNWCGPRFDRRDVVTREEFRRYTDFRPSRGDFGIVASMAAGPVAVGWALFLPAEDAGYGFADEHTPEFSLWVDSRSRGHGIGRDVTERLLDEAVSRGLDTVSLSVERENERAARLYRSMGFVDVAGRAEDGVMVWTRPVTGRRRSRTPG